MPGIDITRLAQDKGAPVIILVEPQMAENIGTAARAMANFALARLRLVAPRDGWPNGRAYPSASGANRILDEAQVFPTLQAAIDDLHLVFAATARAHDQIKPVVGPKAAVTSMRPRIAAGEQVGIVFGRERNGLLAEEVSLAHAILTYPVNPDFSSLNLAQAVLVLGYEWFSQAHEDNLPFEMVERSEPASMAQARAFFAMVEGELDRVEYYRPPEKRDSMVINLRNIVQRMNPTRQDLATLHGAILAIAEGVKGPARGGTLDEERAGTLRTLLAKAASDKSGGQAPVRGLARLLRRNPIEAERVLWDHMMKDRRFAGRGFKRAIPIGPHVADIVSFDLRLVIDFDLAGEDAAAADVRAAKRGWLAERGYRVVVMKAEEVERDCAGPLDLLQQAIEAEI
jgi:tRNA/rRNA methyltransferase